MKATIKKIIRITGRIALWLLAFLLLVFLLVFIVWKVPAVHNYAVRKGTTYFNDKTQGNLSIEKVDLKLPFYIGIEGIELKGPATNDIVSVGQLEKINWVMPSPDRKGRLNFSRADETP